MLARPRILALPLLASVALSCDADSTSQPPPVPIYEASGPHPVGVTTLALHDTARNRDLRVEVWYPADASAKVLAATGFSVAEFAAAPDRATLEGLLASAPAPGTTRVAHAARDAAPLAGEDFAVVVFSHCYDCTRFSVLTIAERLASHGITVVAPDHTNGTLFDKLAGTDAPLDTTFLATRAADVRFTLDRVLDASAAEIPATLRGRFDAEKVGVMGHSFGGVTAGVVLTEDARPKAGLALAVPMENPLLPGAKLADVHVPLLFLLATEDNSIGPIGNDFIRQNFAAANPPVSEIDVTDAGHWSVSDICGIVPDFDAGCATDDVRQTNSEPFTYADIEAVRGIAASYATAFFLGTLGDDAEALAYVKGAHPGSLVTSQSR